MSLKLAAEPVCSPHWLTIETTVANIVHMSILRVSTFMGLQFIHTHSTPVFCIVWGLSDYWLYSHLYI